MIVLLFEMYLALMKLKESCHELLEQMCLEFSNDASHRIQQFSSDCETFLNNKILPLVPKLKPFISELTDSRPGVSMSNHQVRLRCAELCLIQRAPGDS